jgi:hypothetical protein
MVLQKLHAKTGYFTTASKGVSCILKECRKQCLIGCVYDVITGLTLQASSICNAKTIENNLWYTEMSYVFYLVQMNA